MILLAALACSLPQSSDLLRIERMSVLEQRSGWRAIWDGKTLEGWTVVRARDCAPDSKDPEILEGWLVASESTGVSLRIARPYSDCEISCDYRSWNRPELRHEGLRVRIEGLIHEHHESVKLDYIENPNFEVTPWSLEQHEASREGLWDILLAPSIQRHAVRNVRLRNLHDLPGRELNLFDEKSLEGWHLIGDASFGVDERSILGQTSSGKTNSFLVTNESYGDFLLTLELKNEEPGNSGIQIRSRVVGEEPKSSYASGYQIEIDPSARAWSGGLYEERGRGWLQNLEQNEAGRKAFRPGEWNRYRIECIGPWIRAWVNDVPTADAFDPEALAGIIGLQVHAGQDTKVRFRGFRMQDFGKHAWNDIGASSLGTEGAKLGHDFGIRLTRKADRAPNLSGYRLCFRGERKAIDSTPGVAGEMIRSDENCWSIELGDARLANAKEKHDWKQLVVLAYADRVALFRDHELLLDSRAFRGSDGPLVWIAGPQSTHDGLLFERVESLEPLGR